jgi:hypothetical protein
VHTSQVLGFGKRRNSDAVVAFPRIHLNKTNPLVMRTGKNSQFFPKGFKVFWLQESPFSFLFTVVGKKEKWLIFWMNK